MSRSWLGRWVRKAGRHTTTPAAPYAPEPSYCWYCGEPDSKPCRTGTGQPRDTRHEPRPESPPETTLRRELAAEAERIIHAVDALTEACWFCPAPAGQPCRTVHGRAPGTVRAETHKGRGRP